MALKEAMARLEELTKAWGYVVWLDQQDKWHTSEVYNQRGGDSIVRYLTTRLRVRYDTTKFRASKNLADLDGAPPYIEVDDNAELAKEAWVIPAPKRYQALNIAKNDWKRQQLQAGQKRQE